ncbi:WXG100-like domain-containing protein [Nocardia niigatensis]
MSWTTALGNNIPSWLMWALNFGQAYPKGDEDRLYALGDAWHQAASALENYEPELKHITGQVPQYYEGDGATAVGKEFADLFDANSEHSIPKLIESMHALGHDTRATGTEIEYVKIQEEVFAALTLWTVLSLMASLYGDALVPGFLRAAQKVVAEMADAAADRIGALAARAGLDTLAKPLIREIVMPLTEATARNAPLRYGLRTLGGTVGGALMGAELDASTQIVQMWEGHRDDGFDLKKTFQTSIAWGAGGLLGAPAHLGAAELLTNRLSSRLGGLAAGGIGGMAGGVGMYAGGLGNQIYDHFTNGARVDWDFDPKLLVGGAVLGGLGGAKHGLNNGGSPDGDLPGGGTGPDTSRAGDPEGPKGPPVITPESDAEGLRLFRSFAKEAHSDVLGNQPEHIQQVGEDLTRQALRIRETAKDQGGFSEQQVTALEDLRSQWHAVKPPDGSAPHPAGNQTPEFRAGAADPTARPVQAPVLTPEPAVRPPAPERTALTGLESNGRAAVVGPERGAGQPDSRIEGKPTGTTPEVGQDEKSTTHLTGRPTKRVPTVVSDANPLNAGKERAAVPSEQDLTEMPTPTEVPQSTGDPVAPQESSDITPVAPRHGGEEAAPAYDAHRRRSGDEFSTILEIRVHLADAEQLPPDHIRAITENVRTAVEEAFNSGAKLGHGDLLAVRVEITGESDAHLTVEVGHPDGAEPQVWSRDTDSAKLVQRLREQLGLSSGDGEFALTPNDLARITDDIMTANTASPLRDLRDHDVAYPPRPLQDELEDPAYQAQMLVAAREDDRYAAGFDPRTHPAAKLVNDGGMAVPGRSTNCLEVSLAALFTFKGRPIVALATRIEMLGDGTLGYRSGEPIERAMDVLGGAFTEFSGDIPAQYRQLQELIAELGPDSAALVSTNWQRLDADTGERIFRPDGSPVIRGGHASLIVFPRDAPEPVWWDPQADTFSPEPPAEFLHRAGRLRAIVLLPDGSPHLARTIEHDAGGLGLPGPGPLDGPAVRALPVRTGLGDLTGADGGGSAPGRVGGPAPDGPRRPDGGDLSVSELGAGNGDGALPGPRAPGESATGPSDLPASAPDPSAVDARRSGPDRVRDPNRIPDRHKGNGAGVHPVHRSEDQEVSPAGHVVGNGRDLGDQLQPEQSGLAARGVLGVLTGSRPEESGAWMLTGMPESPWDPIGPEQPHLPTTSQLANELQSAAVELASNRNEIAIIVGSLNEMARQLGIDPAGLRGHDLQRAMEAVLQAEDDEFTALHRYSPTPAEMFEYWDKYRAEQILAVERNAFRRSMYQAFGRYHSAEAHGMEMRKAAESIAADDVLAALGAKPGGPPRVGVIHGDPVEIVVVSRSAEPDDPVEPKTRNDLLERGAIFRYLQVRVDDSGEVTVVEVRGPTDPQASPVTPPAASTPHAEPTTPAFEAPPPVAEPAELAAQRDTLAATRDTLLQRLDAHASTLQIPPELITPRPGEARAKWRARADEVVAALHQRPSAGKGVTGVLPRVKVEDVPRFRHNVDELAQMIDALDDATSALAQIDNRIEAASWLEGERAALVAREKTLRDLCEQIGATVGLTPDQLEPETIDRTLARLYDPGSRLESTTVDRAVQELGEKSAERQRIAKDIATIDADLVAVTAGAVPYAYHNQLVNDKAVLERERDDWRDKRDARAVRLNLPDPDRVLAPARLAETLTELREQVSGFQTTAAIGEDPAGLVPEQVSPQELARRNQAIDNLEDAAERVNELNTALDELDQRLPAAPPSEDAISPADQAELVHLVAERADLLSTHAELFRRRAELTGALGVEPADLGPSHLERTLEDLYDAKVPLQVRDRIHERIRNLAEVAQRLHSIDNEIGRLQDRMAEIAGAGKKILSDSGARRVTDRVGIVDGHEPRVIVVGPREEFGQPAVDHDVALAQAISRDARVAIAMTQRASVIEYRRIVASEDGSWRTETMPPPERLVSTPQPLPWTGLDVAMWKDGHGEWHPVDPAVPLQTTGRGSTYKPKAFSLKEIPDGLSTAVLDTNQALIEDQFIPGHPGQVDKAFLIQVPGGGRLDESLLHTFKDPFAGTPGMVFRLTVEAPKLLGFKALHPDDPHTFHPRIDIKSTAWYKNYFADRPIVRQPMVRQWEAWEHGRRPGETEGPQPDVTRWAEVQKWADQQYERFRADDGDLEQILNNLADKQMAIREAQVDKLLDATRKELIKHLKPDLARLVRTSGIQLRDELPETRDALIDHLALGERLEALDLVAAPDFTLEQIRQIKQHLMADELLIDDPHTGDPVRRGLGNVADVAEAWLRLIDGIPGPADILLLRDALAESNYLRENPSAFWKEANQHAIAMGYDWDSNRPIPAAWRAKIDYAPASLRGEPESKPETESGDEQRGPESEPAPGPSPEAEPESQSASGAEPESEPTSLPIQPVIPESALDPAAGSVAPSEPGEKTNQPEAEPDSPSIRRPWLWGVGMPQQPPGPPTGPVPSGPAPSGPVPQPGPGTPPPGTPEPSENPAPGSGSDSGSEQPATETPSAPEEPETPEPPDIPFTPPDDVPAQPPAPHEPPSPEPAQPPGGWLPIPPLPPLPPGLGTGSSGSS